MPVNVDKKRTWNGWMIFGRTSLAFQIHRKLEKKEWKSVHPFRNYGGKKAHKHGDDTDNKFLRQRLLKKRIK